MNAIDTAQNATVLFVVASFVVVVCLPIAAAVITINVRRWRKK